MDITVSFENGRWIIEPQLAIVLRGTKIRWVFRAPKLEVSRLRWMVDFNGNVPSETQKPELVIETKNTRFGSREGSVSALRFPPGINELGYGEELLVNHRGVTAPITADKPGDFKYDLRVANAETGETIGDEDPWIFVVSPVFTVNQIFVPR